jgi:isoaspartyl peptidase/L-asparaginase-like protein (Ntn-hydrolase superfamily)
MTDTPTHDAVHDEWDLVRKSAYRRGLVDAYSEAADALKKITRPSAAVKDAIVYLEERMKAAYTNG